MSGPDRPARPTVFVVSASIVALFVLAGVLAPAELGRAFEVLLAQITRAFGWFYALAVAGFVGLAAWLGFGPYAHVRLGADHSRPEFGALTWFAMLFSAGMGIGLVFYGVAEPMLHYASPPRGDPRTLDAAREAMVITYFHWGLHAWCIYAVTGAALGYFAFRRGLPLTIRSSLHPLLGERVHGALGHAVDVFAVLGTLFGLATSLGLGAEQVASGLAVVAGVPAGTLTQIVVIAVVTAAATLSVVSGLHHGVRRLSEINMVLAAGLLAFVALTGPTLFLLDAYVDNLGAYLGAVVPRTFWRNAHHGADDWHATWTIFYWGWWIAWAPFVGTFIARISRGRTLREFVLAVTLVPTLLTFGWLTVFGDTALFLERAEAGIARAALEDPSTAVYALLDRLPLATVSSTLTVVVVALFFVTSSDSGSLVVDMLTSGGDPDPPVGRRVFWAVSEGVVAAVLLLAGGLMAFRAAAIATALPFCAVLLLAGTGLVLALRRHERGP